MELERVERDAWDEYGRACHLPFIEAKDRMAVFLAANRATQQVLDVQHAQRLSVAA